MPSPTGRSHPGLDALTRAASEDVAIRDWLFPGSEGLDVANAWFTVLDPAFDPLPIWRDYRGPTMMLFSEHDDSTDTAAAVERLRTLGIEAHILPAAQHLALQAGSRCDGELAERTAFSPALFEAIDRFAGADEGTGR